MSDEQIAVYAQARVALPTEVGLRVCLVDAPGMARTYLLAVEFPAGMDVADEHVLVTPSAPESLQFGIGSLCRYVEGELRRCRLYEWATAACETCDLPIRVRFDAAGEPVEVLTTCAEPKPESCPKRQAELQTQKRNQR